jgi:hypothetical protein
VTNRIWNEGGQHFTYQGSCIRTLKPGMIRLSYGDARLRELRSERASAEPEGTSGLCRVLSELGQRLRLRTGGRSSSARTAARVEDSTES